MPSGRSERRAGVHGPGQRRRLRHEVHGQAVRRVPASALRGRVRGHRRRPRHRAPHHHPTWRPDLGRGCRRSGSDVLLHLVTARSAGPEVLVNPGKILLVEDNPDDVALTLRALKRHNITNDVVVAPAGAQALDYLFGPDGGKHAPELPAVVLLDLRLPTLT